jgi:hypothetical protein
MIADVAAPFRFENEEIRAELLRKGFEGDPESPSDAQPLAELSAAIALLESQPHSAGNETTIRQGSVSRTVKGGDFSPILATLRHRLNSLLGGGIAVAMPDYPETRRNQGWAGFGLPIR